MRIVYPIRLHRHRLKNGPLVRCNLQISDCRQTCSHLVPGQLVFATCAPCPFLASLHCAGCSAVCRLNGHLVRCSPDTSPSSCPLLPGIPTPLTCTAILLCGTCAHINCNAHFDRRQNRFKSVLVVSDMSPTHFCQQLTSIFGRRAKMSNQQHIQVGKLGAAVGTGRSGLAKINVILNLVRKICSV